METVCTQSLAQSMQNHEIFVQEGNAYSVKCETSTEVPLYLVSRRTTLIL